MKFKNPQILGDIALLINAEFVGDKNFEIFGINEIHVVEKGDIVFVELPEIGQSIDAETDAAIVESVKAASDVYSPISGEVTEVNSMLEDQPEIINSSPYEDGWFYKMMPSDLGEIENLLSPEDYSEVCED